MITGLQRTLSTLSGQTTDRVPVALHNFLMAAYLLNIPLDKYTQSGRLMAQAQINAWELFGHDVILMENGVAGMAEALGCEVAYCEDQPPHVKKPLFQTLPDFSKLDIPDPWSTHPICEVLKSVRLVKETVGDRAFVMGRADQGPMALAAAMYGPEPLLLDIASGHNIQAIHDLIEYCTRSTMRYATALHEAGADGTCIGGYGISISSPDIYLDFECPYEKMFVDHCHKENFLAGLHICGYEDPILAEMISTGADWLELDPLTTPETAAKLTKNRTAVLGMIDAAETLLTGSPERVASECKERLEQLDNARFIIGPGCALPENTPVANIMALVQSAIVYDMK